MSVKVVPKPESLLSERKKSLAEGRLPEAVEFAKKACEAASARKEAVLTDAKELAISCAVKDPRMVKPASMLLMNHFGLDHDEAHLLIESRIRRGEEKKPGFPNRLTEG